MAYLPLSTANLPDPAIDPAQGSSPEDYFNTVLYTGNGTTNAITGVGFQPSLIWTKSRSATYDHFLTDELIHNDYLRPNQTNAASTGVFASIDSDGFTISGNSGNNTSGASAVAWNWKANGSGVSNTDGSITSTVSANTESGFSIVSYTSPNSASDQTVGHGLNQAPEMLIIKNRDNTYNWDIWHKDLTGNNYGLIFNTNAELVNRWSSTAPTSTVFSTINNFQHNGTDDYIAYCFHSVEGFSKFGSYIGNGSADGPFVYTGFRPAFVLIKRTNATENWCIYDDARDTYNVTTKQLYPDQAYTEDSGSGKEIDLLSNGFKPRNLNNRINGSGSTYIYMAFADDGGAFKYSVAR
jgi:hypothetical protein